MKTRLSILFLFLLAVTVFGQGGPIWRNSWTTNQAPPVRGTNLGVTNTASGFMWKFYGWPDSNMVARLSDVSNIVGSSSAAITNAVASVWTNGAAVVASAATNIEFFGVVASNAPVGQIGNVRVWIQPSSGTNVNFFFVTNGLYASNVFATNISVDTFYVNTEMQLSNALRVPFGGTGTNTNNLGAFYIGNGTNCPQWLNTNVFANWLSNQIGVAPTGDFIFKSNGFGTNLSLLGYFSVSTTGLFVTNWAGTFPRVGVNTNSPRATLHVNVEYPIFCGLLVASNGWLGATPSLIITNGFVGIGRHDPRLALDVRGDMAVSGSGKFTNGLAVSSGAICISGFTNWGPANFSNYNVISTYQTSIAVNTNAPTGIAVVQIAGGILGPGITATNQYVLLYTNPIYGKGFAVETNGRVTANTFVGAGISAQGLTVTTNGTDYISTTNLYFIGQPKITNADGDVSIDITPGAATGAFVMNSNGIATNLIVFGFINSFGAVSISNILNTYSSGGDIIFVSDPTEGVEIVDFEGLTERWKFGTNADNPQMPLRRKELTNATLAFQTNFGTLVFPPNNTPVSTSSLAGAWNIYESNSVLNIMQPSGGAGLMGVQISTNSGGTIQASALTLPVASSIPSPAQGNWVTYNSNTTLFIEGGVSGAVRKTITVNTNGVVTLPGQTTNGSSFWVPLGGVGCGLGYNVGWINGAVFNAADARSVRLGNSSFIGSRGTNGASLYFPVINQFSVPSATLLTNDMWGLGNTNGTLTFMTSTNGSNRLDMMGIDSSNIWVSSQMTAQQPLGLFGAMMFNTTNYGQTFGASYTNIKGFNVWNTNLFTVNTNTGYATNLVAGYYRCNISISMVGANGGIYEGCMLTNDVDSEMIGFEFQHDTPARYHPASGVGTIFLPAYTGCSFAIKSDTPGAIQIRRGSIVIGTP